MKRTDFITAFIGIPFFGFIFPLQSLAQDVGFIACGVGETYETFAFQGLKNFSTFKGLEKITAQFKVNGIQNIKLTNFGPGLGQIRFDTCTSEDLQTIRLERIVMGSERWGITEVYRLTSEKDERNISKIVYQAFHSEGGNFDAFLTDSASSIFGTLFNTWVIGENVLLTSVAAERITADGNTAIEATTNVVFVGTLERGDPFSGASSLECDIDAKVAQTNFKLGSALFAVEYCYWQREGRTQAFVLTSMTVKDTSENVPVEFRKTQTLAGEAMNGKYAQTNNHHNGCDSFKIDFGFATYFATATDRVGCGNIVAGAPIPEPEERKLSYRMVYANGVTAEGKSDKKNCSHFLFNCKEEN